MEVSYNHAYSPHTLGGAQAALSQILPLFPARSMLDVGCGTGTWLKAARDLGVTDTFGIDGLNALSPDLGVMQDSFSRMDLSRPFDLSRRFDLVLCLEVAEHLPAESGSVLVQSLVAHGETILFAAACPGQPGQHHVNCQWPSYWQARFNSLGYACDDAVRWMLWEDKRIEPWYRQNMFLARLSPRVAGKEPRIRPVINPDMMPILTGLTRNLDPRLASILRRTLHPVRAFLKRFSA